MNFAFFLLCCQSLECFICKFFIFVEKLGKLGVVLTLIAFVGTVFITQPPFIFGSQGQGQIPFATRIFGVLWAAVSSIATAVCFVVIRKLGPAVHFSKSVFYFSWIGVVFTLMYLGITGKPFLTCFQSLPLLAGGSFLLFLAQCFLTLAYQREIAGRIALVQTTEVPLAFLLEYCILGTTPSLYSFIGAALILLCFILLSIKSILRAVRH